MVLSTLLQNRMVLSSLHQSCLLLSLLLQNLVVLPLFLLASEPHGSLLSPQNLVVLSYLLASDLVVLSFYLRTSWPSPLWLPGLGLNPSTHLPLQPHFRLLLQSATPASIPVFFQLYWAAIVSLGRCGPMA